LVQRGIQVDHELPRRIRIAHHLIDGVSLLDGNDCPNISGIRPFTSLGGDRWFLRDIDLGFFCPAASHNLHDSRDEEWYRQNSENSHTRWVVAGSRTIPASPSKSASQ